MTFTDDLIEPLGEDARKTLGLILSIANLEAVEAMIATGNVQDAHTAINSLREQATLQRQTGLLAAMQKAFDQYCDDKSGSSN